MSPRPATAALDWPRAPRSPFTHSNKDNSPWPALAYRCSRPASQQQTLDASSRPTDGDRGRQRSQIHSTPVQPGSSCVIACAASPATCVSGPDAHIVVAGSTTSWSARTGRTSNSCERICGTSAHPITVRRAPLKSGNVKAGGAIQKAGKGAFSRTGIGSEGFFSSPGIPSGNHQPAIPAKPASHGLGSRFQLATGDHQQPVIPGLLKFCAGEGGFFSSAMPPAH